MANCLIGTYEHTMDAKGRMAFPTKLRDRLGVSFIVTIGLDGCLFVYSNEDWEEFTQKLQTLTGAKAKAAKMFIVNACVVEPDKQGRILIPQNLREFAGLDHVLKSGTAQSTSPTATILQTKCFQMHFQNWQSDSCSEDYILWKISVFPTFPCFLRNV